MSSWFLEKTLHGKAVNTSSPSISWGVGATAQPYLQEAAEPQRVFASRAAGGPWERSFHRAWSQITRLPVSPYMWAFSNGNIPPQLPSCSRGAAGSVGLGTAEQGTVNSSTLSCSSVSALLASCHRNRCRLSCHQKKVCALHGRGWSGGCFFIDLLILKAYFWGGFIFPPFNTMHFKLILQPHTPLLTKVTVLKAVLSGAPPH